MLSPMAILSPRFPTSDAETISQRSTATSSNPRGISLLQHAPQAVRKSSCGPSGCSQSPFRICLFLWTKNECTISCYSIPLCTSRTLGTGMFRSCKTAELPLPSSQRLRSCFASTRSGASSHRIGPCLNEIPGI